MVIFIYIIYNIYLVIYNECSDTNAPHPRKKGQRSFEERHLDISEKCTIGERF